MNRLRTADLEHHGGETVWSKAAHFMEIEKWGGEGGEGKREREGGREKRRKREIFLKDIPPVSSEPISGLASLNEHPHDPMISH